MLWCCLLSTCLMGNFDGQWRWKRCVYVCVRASSGAHNLEPQGFRAESGLSVEFQARPWLQGGRRGSWGREKGKWRWVSVSTPPHHKAWAVCQTEIYSCGFGPTDTSLSGSVLCTHHRAHRLIPRLKFTFAPSRLNSHFTSSHNTPLSRDMEMMGFLFSLHAKYAQQLHFFTH